MAVGDLLCDRLHVNGEAQELSPRRSLVISSVPMPDPQAGGGILGCRIMGLSPRMDVPMSGFTEVDLRNASERANALKEAILRNINHEFRSPLNKIIGYGELLSDLIPASSAEAHKYLNRIMLASQCIARNLQAILDLSKFEAGDFAARPSEIALWPLVKRQLFEIRPTAEAKELQLQHEVEDPNLGACVDEYCLTQALANILDNAVKFTERGRIVVRLRTQKPSHVCIEVEDTGTGVDPSFIPRMFEPFSQQDCSAARRYQGLGLGLALAKIYLDATGGELLFTPGKQAGSLFKVLFRSSV